MPAVILALLVACVCPEIVGVIPADGAGPVARDQVITATFSDAPGDVAFVVTGPDGDIAGTVAIAESTAVFTPSEPLPASANIDWIVTTCDSSAAGAFQTGTVASAAETAALQGNTYAMDLAAATWVSPPNGGALVSQFFAGVILVGVESATEAELDCIGATGQATSSGGWQQDPCFATIDFPAVDFTGNPYFAITAEVVEFDVQGITARVHDVTLSGGLTDQRVSDGQFSGEVDFREYEELGDGCGMIGLIGLSCVACRADDEVQCLWIEAHDVEGDVVPGLQLVANESPDECTPDTGGQ